MYLGLSVCDVQSMNFSFQNYLFRVTVALGNTFLEALCKERRTAAMNLRGGKMQARFDKLV